ncbi:MAG: class I SAM-dependent methyltransferase [archaeon]|nr:class I SAM-dependent methyltransferase [archaeon]
MNTNQLLENKYWTDISTEKEAKQKIITHENFHNSTEHDVKIILENLKLTKEDNVIDFGCGIGRLVKPISEHCNMILGLDISEKTLHYSTKYCDGVKNVLFKPLHSDSCIDLGNERIDAIYSLLVLQHIEKCKVLNLLYEFNRLLKVGGKVFLQFPNMLKSEEMYKRSLEHQHDLGTLFSRLEFYTKEELQFLFAFAHLDIVKFIEEGTDFYILAEKKQPYDIEKVPLAVGTKVTL